MILLKKRTSLRAVFHTTLNVDMSSTDANVEKLVDSYMNLILDYDAHCEKKEQEISEREKEEHRRAQCMIFLRSYEVLYHMMLKFLVILYFKDVYY